MNEFSRGDFHWNPKAFGAVEQNILSAVDILNGLSPEQADTVRLFGRSQYEEGQESGEAGYDL